MELVFRIILVIVGIINFLPVIGSIAPSKISKAYGIDAPDPNLELLLRHRAVLFGIVGGFMIIAAVIRQFYTLATIMGLISMISFLILFFLGKGTINSELTKVRNIDAIAAVLLIIGYGLLLFFPGN